jgi:hypothetical protein
MKHIIRKILKEQDEIINVPDLDFFDDNWEDVLEFARGRKFRVRGNLIFRDICPERFENLVEIDGNLNLNTCEQLISLGNLKRVGGYLSLIRCQNLTSLGNLEYVGGKLTLYDCIKIKSLENLKRVDGYLDLEYCENLASLGNLEYVGESLFIRHTPIADMYSEEEIRGMVEVRGKIHII